MTTLLHRFTIKPGHLDAWLELWPQEVALRRAHGFTMHQAYLETDAEPKLSWLYSHPDAAAAELSVQNDPRTAELAALKAPHVFGNLKIRPVQVEGMTGQKAAARTVIMRRYSIVGSWREFLEIWRRIVPLRQRHGFPCLFAVSDRPENMFTWAFGFDGDWNDFAEAQRPYYRDPDRVPLRRVFDYMADYAIHPARTLPIPPP